MPLYYFDVIDSGPLLDDCGTDCRDDADARRSAMKFIADVASDEMPGVDRRTFSVLVRDEQRRPVYSMALSMIGLDLR